ncbi:MAG TPA: hypothetical protein VER17_04795 [Tepidisphaeraceae bacterium]|nr:hypothetical protein [Tepidisphaeraceae bacterium]
MRDDEDKDAIRTRPLTLAVRSLRLLGIVCGLFGLVFTIAFGYLNRYQTYGPYFILIGLIVWLIPGVLFFTCAWQIGVARSRRAAVGAIVLSLIHLGFAVTMLVAQFRLTPISPIPVLLSVAWIAAMVQLIAHLRRSLPLLEMDLERRPGFEVGLARLATVAQPVLPVLPLEASARPAPAAPEAPPPPRASDAAATEPSR